jgi:hypothetical protein
MKPTSFPEVHISAHIHCFLADSVCPVNALSTCIVHCISPHTHTSSGGPGFACLPSQVRDEALLVRQPSRMSVSLTLCACESVRVYVCVCVCLKPGFMFVRPPVYLPPSRVHI